MALGERMAVMRVKAVDRRGIGESRARSARRCPVKQEPRFAARILGCRNPAGNIADGQQGTGSSHADQVE